MSQQLNDARQRRDARQNYKAVPKKAKTEDPERYTKVPHEYGDILVTGGKLGGPLQRDLLYWIERHTWGMNVSKQPGKIERPEFARLSLTALAKLCRRWDDERGELRPVERKNVAIELGDLERRGIIESRDRKGCGPTTAKMYKLTPERWKAAPPYKPPTPKEIAETAECEPPEDEDDSQPADQPQTAELTVTSGKLSRPQPVTLRPSRNAEPVTIRLVYNPSGFDFPVTFRARTGANGRIQVSANPWRDGEQKATDCSRGRPQLEKSNAANKRVIEFRDAIQRVALEIWNFAVDDDLVERITTGAGDAPPELFEHIALLKLRSNGRHVPGLMVNLAQQAARSHTAYSQLAARQQARRTAGPNPPETAGQDHTPPDFDIEAHNRRAAELAGEQEARNRAAVLKDFAARTPKKRSKEGGK